MAGGLIGLERTDHGRPAGFRTHSLACTASSLLRQRTRFQWEMIVGMPLETVRIDPTRMAQGIMTGIGFLGAGVDMKEGKFFEYTMIIRTGRLDDTRRLAETLAANDQLLGFRITPAGG